MKTKVLVFLIITFSLIFGEQIGKLVEFAGTVNVLAQGKTQIAHAMLIQSKYEYQKSIYYMEYLMESGANND